MNEKVLALGQKCLRLVTSDKSTSSFLGGKPLVGGQFDWPRKNNKPLGFIGQLDLKEINLEKEIDWLPQIGRLLFFMILKSGLGDLTQKIKAAGQFYTKMVVLSYISMYCHQILIKSTFLRQSNLFNQKALSASLMDKVSTLNLLGFQRTMTKNITTF